MGTQDIWTIEDVEAGDCDPAAVGLPRPDYNRAQAIARRHTAKVVQALVDIALDPKADTNARIKAGNSILDRGWGKPTETLKADVNSRIEIVAPWMNPQRLSYQEARVIDNEAQPNPILSDRSTGQLPTPNEVAAARQSHLDANAVAREKDRIAAQERKYQDAKRAGNAGPHPDPTSEVDLETARLLRDARRG
jgi:hypothetical protein